MFKYYNWMIYAGIATFTIILLAGFAPAAYPEEQTVNVLKIKSDKPGLINQSGGHEKRMIVDNGWGCLYSVQVTTENQAKFDKDHDGYLTGSEMQNYLRTYNR